jgi:hypothetical protein
MRDGRNLLVARVIEERERACLAPRVILGAGVGQELYSPGPATGHVRRTNLAPPHGHGQTTAAAQPAPRCWCACSAQRTTSGEGSALRLRSG